MIVKRIRASARRVRRSLTQIEASINALTTYAIDADPTLLKALERQGGAAKYVLDAAELGVEPGEKVEFHGTRNLVGDSLMQQQRQMLAASLLAPASADPLEHYVISWSKGEYPNREQIEEVVTVFSAEMGYDQSHLVWAVHSNTANWHLHLVASRINLMHGGAVNVGDGWDIDRLHQVIALIEERQGWASEKNAIYVADQDVVYDRATNEIVRRADSSREGCYKRKRSAPERGQAPAHDKVAQILRDTSTWRELHHLLSEEGAIYSAKGSGAVIQIGDQRMKASDFGRDFAMKKMEARLGKYEPDAFREKDPHELYQLALREERARLRQTLNAALDELRRRRKQALRQVRQSTKSKIQQLLEEERVQHIFDRIEKEVKHEFDVIRRTIAASYLNRDRWIKAGKPPAQTVSLPSIIFSGIDPYDRDLAAELNFRAEPHAAGVDYVAKSGSRAVSDYGIVLLVYHHEAKAIDLALSLARKRTDKITVSGPPAFLALCREVADARGYDLVDINGKPLTSAVKSAALRSQGHSVGTSAPKQTLKSEFSSEFEKNTPIPPPPEPNARSASDLDDISLESLWGAYRNRSAKGR